MNDFVEADLFCWVCEADTPRGRVPVGVIVGRPFVHGTMIMGSFSWFEWASKRNVYESVVNAINELRKEAPMVFHVDQTAKKLAVQLARHGLLRRVGTLHVTGEPLAVFESK